MFRLLAFRRAHGRLAGFLHSGVELGMFQSEVLLEL